MRKGLKLKKSSSKTGSANPFPVTPLEMKNLRRMFSRKTHPELYDQPTMPAIPKHINERKGVEEAASARMNRFTIGLVPLEMRLAENPLMAKWYRRLRTSANKGFLDAVIGDNIASSRSPLSYKLDILFYPNVGRSRLQFVGDLKESAIWGLGVAVVGGQFKLREELDAIAEIGYIPERLKEQIYEKRKQFRALLKDITFDACMAELVGDYKGGTEGIFAGKIESDIFPNPNPKIRRSALAVLGWLKKSESRPIFLRYLNARPYFWSTALRGLAELGAESDLNVIRQMAKSKNKEMAQKAKEVMENFKGKF